MTGTFVAGLKSTLTYISTRSFGDFFSHVLLCVLTTDKQKTVDLVSLVVEQEVEWTMKQCEDGVICR